VTVDWATANGTATAPADYTADSDQLTFVPGDTQEMITVAVQGDLLDEGASETFNVNLSNPVNATISDGTGVGTITDDDSAPSVTLSASASTLDEGESDSPATVTATLSDLSALEVTVNLQLLGSATLAADYTRSGTSIVIPAGSMSGFIEIDAVDDAVVEPDETVIVSITTVTNGTESGVQQETITILDDDASTVTVNDEVTTEGGDLVFQVILGNAVQGGLTVDVTLTDVTATGGASPLGPGEDYDQVVAQLTFAGTAGEVEEFTVETLDDAIVEDAEMFTVTLSASNPSVDDSDTATGTINDNDASTVLVDDVVETEGTVLLFTVTLGNAVQGGLTVDVMLTDVEATGGAAPLVSPVDYDNVVSQLNFAGTAGETQQFTVATLDDGVPEGAETFTVILTASHPSVTDTDTGTGTINDN
jgi:hypothetical protein